MTGLIIFGIGALVAGLILAVAWLVGQARR